MDSLHKEVGFPVPEGLSVRLGVFENNQEVLDTLSRLKNAALAFTADLTVPGRLTAEMSLPVSVDDVSDAVRLALTELLYVRGVDAGTKLTEADLMSAVRPRWDFCPLVAVLVRENEVEYGPLTGWNFESFALNAREGLAPLEALLSVALYGGGNAALNRMFAPLRADFIRNGEHINAEIFSRMKRIMLLNAAMAPRQV